MRNQQSLIFISMNRWNTIQQRSHHLARCLSKTYNVLYVDPCAYSILGYVRGKILSKSYRNLAPRLHTINPNLMVFTPPALLPFSEENVTINRINHWILTIMIKRLIRFYKMENPILWLNYPIHVPLIGNFDELLVCYDCMDNYQAFFTTGSRRTKLLRRLELQMLDHVDIVITTARSLQEKFKIQGFNAYYIPNGVGEQFISYTPNQPETHLIDWPLGNGPVIGYIGYISRWLDFDAVLQLAMKHPDWRFVFIGPSDIDLNKFRSNTNLYFLGSKPYKILTEYVARFDVATIPFIINDLTRDVNPVKIFEYFALGKPVVASRIPELVSYESVCYLGESTTDLVSQVEKAVEDSVTKKNLQESEQLRKNIALKNTWDARSEEIIKILISHIS